MLKIWRLEWPNGMGVYSGASGEEDAYKLLPPCWQFLHDKADDLHPIWWRDEGLTADMKRLKLARLHKWHFGFASREAFDAWFEPKALAMANASHCANSMLLVVCYEVAECDAVVCGSHQLLFDPARATRLEDCPCSI